MQTLISAPALYNGFVMPKAFRKERGFTQKELAEKTDLTQTLASDYERGKLRLNAEMILRFATALEVSTADLLSPPVRFLSGSPAVRCCAAWNGLRSCRNGIN